MPPDNPRRVRVTSSAATGRDWKRIDAHLSCVLVEVRYALRPA